MGKIYFTSVVALLLFGLFGYSQSNNPAPYCYPIFAQTPCTNNGPSNMAGNWSNDFINSFSTMGGVVNITNNNSGCCGLPSNYIYYCNSYLQVNAGQTVTCTIQSGDIYSMGFAVFIDWNQDAVFNTTTEKVFGSPNVPTAASFNNYTFTVPPTQPNGTYRMRVRCNYASPGSMASFNGCGGSSWGEVEDYNLIIGSPPPAASPITATASPNSTVCLGQNAPLGVTFSGTTSPTFSWGGPNSFASAIQNPTVVNTTTASNGYYYVAITSATCPVMASTHVYIIQGPNINIIASTTSLCSGATVTLTATNSTNYTWTPIASNNTVVVVSPSVTSIYTLSSTGSNSCITEKTITLSILPNHTISIASTPSILCAGDQATLTSSGASNYTWTPGGINPSIVVSPTITTTYSVVGTGSLCSSSSAYTLVVSPCTNINELGFKSTFNIVFQNPFHDELKLFSDKEVVVILRDASGKVVLTNRVVNEANLDTSLLPKGIYFLSIENGLINNPVKVIKD